MSKIHQLPGTTLSPKVVLARTMDEVDRIKAVTIIIQYDDDTFYSDWSCQEVKDLCMGCMEHEEAVRSLLRGEQPDSLKSST